MPFPLPPGIVPQPQEPSEPQPPQSPPPSTNSGQPCECDGSGKCQCDQSATDNLRDQITKLEARLCLLESRGPITGPPGATGPAGPPGPAGKPGQPCEINLDQLEEQIAKRLAGKLRVQVERIESQRK